MPGCVPTRQIALLDSMATPPTVFADRYEIVREIAHGGMADVYLARDSKLDRPVALKVLSPELSRDPDVRRALPA